MEKVKNKARLQQMALKQCQDVEISVRDERKEIWGIFDFMQLCVYLFWGRI